MSVLANINVKHAPIPGGIAVVDFYTNHSNPKAFYNQVPVYTQRVNNTHWQALVGIPLLAKIGEKKITIKDFSTRHIAFKVTEHNYKKQYITLKGKNKKYVNPNLLHMDRINKERPILSKARKVFSNTIMNKEAFIRPVSGVTTSPFGFNGNAVFIDHGQGLISVYIHMNKRLVVPGQIVKQGDIIGTIGQTGRATGPHLHFGVYLNQTVVNPNLLINHEI